MFRDVLQCNINDTAVWPFGDAGHGVDGQTATPHYLHQNSNTYHIVSALAKSPIRLYNISEADLIYVDMHCYFMKWLSGAYSEELQQNAYAGRLAMRFVYVYLKSHPAWRATGGRNFVFTLPHSSLISVFDMSKQSSCHTQPWQRSA
jgi:hypothetical protein